MATITELKCAVRETLESRGVLGQLKARIRAEVFSALEDKRPSERPQLSHENLLINELIREYLEFNKYKYTASVLTCGFCPLHCIKRLTKWFIFLSSNTPDFALTITPISGQPEVPLDRQFLAHELNVAEDASSKSV
uniref:FGFR1 oncogene partner (FOP) N-terminal dimerisation domain-containing protein n=1 Tax=Periophthalmus magnuspinnatus TaxID=409849 RepID=A0A3B3ZW72_9GOBI